MEGYKPEYYRYLPHFQPSGVTFFITGRLYGSLPPEALERLKEEKEAAYRRILSESKDEVQRKEEISKLHKRHFAQWDNYLDTNLKEPQWLKNPQVVSILKESFHYWNRKSYDLVAFTIMPNHFHLIIDTTDESLFTKPLYRIMQSIKSYTAKEANKVLNRTGTFWQEESYDHVVRNGQELNNIIGYILENPVKAGLAQNWQAYPHSFINENYW
ncbi:REP-associated tyrosine transposase [Runella sp.]|uniref:REP-associated tyrosine transposase n=1 Tax=Runella sp. TaxID=1960881 RepID=UPI003D0CACDF